MDAPTTSTSVPSTTEAAAGLAQQQPATASTSGSSTASLAARVHCFVEQAPDAAIHFQLMDLGQQLYIWIAVGGAKLQNMYLAIQSRHDAVPAVATLLPDSTTSSAASLAQRLARRVGQPVVCSCNLPAGNEMLQVIAERRLCQELDKLGFTNHKQQQQQQQQQQTAQQQKDQQ